MHYFLLPIRYDAGLLYIAVTDPLDMQMIEELNTLLVDRVHVVVSSSDAIAAAIKKYYGIGAATVQSIHKEARIPDAAGMKNEVTIDLDQDNSSIAKFVNQILVEANFLRATDIHFEPFENDLIVRYRIDGILTDVPLPSDVKELQSSIVTRIKIMANLDIAEHRLPQDGRIKITSKGKEMDLRISVLPTPFGESVNIRLLSSNIALGLESLGFSQENLDIVAGLIEKPHGIILLTGPTGSGKTTTLYACLSKVNNGKRKIITIEDPIEYQLKGITQIQVYPKIGLTFSKGLRSMLRHDPDIMMVGEIRDSETASIAMRVALTGHLVFSTLHTNDAPSAITRLVDMGVEPYLVSSSIECVVAQRLVRKICEHCKVEDTSSETVLSEGAEWQQWKGLRAYKGKGCDLCRGTGYLGRTAIHEVMHITSQVRSHIARGHDLTLIKESARAAGMKMLREDGFLKVSQGITTVEEVIRATETEL
ncbi:GspE/PulE family protein [Candidatus Omnitrophota bacterium]